jgi:MFS family permease
MPSAIRALAHRDFRLYFAGQAISILGSWIQQVALSWLVYRLTGSAALLGITAFCALVPQLLVGPLAGAWIDKHDKRRWLIGVQALLALQAFLLALLTWQGWIGSQLIIVMSLLLGLLNAFDTPLRQSLIGSFVRDRADLPNALALNAMLFNAGRFVGPPVAGLLLAMVAEAACFAINGFSFLALIAGMLLVRSAPPPRAEGAVAQVFREGITYAWRAWAIRMLISVLVALNLTASAYAVLLPVFAKDVFGGDATTLGWLWGAAGSGAFASTLYLAHHRTVPALVPSVISGIVVSGAALLAFATSSSLALAMVSMAALGFGISVSNVGINMLLQAIAPDRLRGRIVSLFTSSRFGFDAIGGLLAGLAAGYLGPARTLLLEAALLLPFAAFLISRRRRLADEVSVAQDYANGHRGG